MIREATRNARDVCTNSFALDAESKNWHYFGVARQGVFFYYDSRLQLRLIEKNVRVCNNNFILFEKINRHMS